MTATTIELPVWNPAALAIALKENGLPGQRSKTAITKLRRERHNRREAAAPDWRENERQDGVLYSLTLRANLRVAARYTAEIERRGGETAIEGQYGTSELVIADRRDGLTLLRADGWRKYGRQGSRHVSLSYLCGRENGQTWAVRVPGTVATVRSAIDWITPAEAKKALQSGRRVERQGDVYAVETTKAHDGKGDLPESHVWDAEARVLAHPEHGTLHLPYPVRFVPQNAYGMGRGAGRAYGD